MSACTVPAPPPTPLGSPIPALLPHAISVSLPAWADNVAYEEGDKRVMGVLETGYPRFFIHRSIQKLSTICLQKFGLPTESCILVPSPTIASQLRQFLSLRATPIPSRIVEFVICPSSTSLVTPTPGAVDCVELYIVLFPKEEFAVAKQFWQHTGDGVSSRLAERALAFLGQRPPTPLAESQGAAAAEGVDGALTPNPEEERKHIYSRNRHYSTKPARGAPLVNRSGSVGGQSRLNTTAIPRPVTPPKEVEVEKSSEKDLTETEEGGNPDLSQYLEERYGRNLPLTSAPLAKLALKRRIAGVLAPLASSSSAPVADHAAEITEIETQRGGQGEKRVKEEDVFLYPTGMSAIWHAHALARALRDRQGEECGKSVCFGFPYTDTLKILQKWGPGCHFFGHGTSSDLTLFASLLSSIRASSSEPRLLALFCEFPSNPLLRSPDLRRLRELADEYGFLIVVDETIGNFVNIEVAGLADVVVSSLTKVFSGETNVMGGSLVISPHSKYYSELHEIMSSSYEDTYYAEDSIYMERNSRDFQSRISRINENAFDLTEWLRSRSLASSSASKRSIIKNVYYPRYNDTENYEAMQRFPTCGKGGFGGLFCLTFISDLASRTFYDNLHCAKGPSLGTNFTLASPYAILAHYLELEWAQEFGVESGLVRVSVGLEEYEGLKGVFEVAVERAERAVFGEEGH